MKNGIHPEYNHDAVVKCACGNTFTTGSVKKQLSVENCSKCHPFYTGSKSLNVETGGRIDKFMKKYNMELKK